MDYRIKITLASPRILEDEEWIGPKGIRCIGGEEIKVPEACARNLIGRRGFEVPSDLVKKVAKETKEDHDTKEQVPTDHALAAALVLEAAGSKPKPKPATRGGK